MAPRRAAPEEDDFHLTFVDRLLILVTNVVGGLVCRATDLLLLLARPRLFLPYLRIFWAELAHSPYRWPRSFEALRTVKASGQTIRELMYGETPLATAVWLFWRAGVRTGSTLVDVGAGRGRVLLAARWLGANAVGLELREEHVRTVEAAVRAAGARLEVADAARAPLTGATHVFLNWCAFSPETKERIARSLAGCAQGTRVIAVTRPVESEAIATRSRHVGLFTWGFERVWIQERT